MIMIHRAGNRKRWFRPSTVAGLKSWLDLYGAVTGTALFVAVAVWITAALQVSR